MPVSTKPIFNFPLNDMVPREVNYMAMSLSKKDFKRVCLLVKLSGIPMVSVNLVMLGGQKSEENKITPIHGPGLEGNFDTMFDSFFVVRP
jgi:hypothetical protein